MPLYTGDYALTYRAILGKTQEVDADPERLMAVRLAVKRVRILHEQGYRVVPWRWGPNSPASRKVDSGWGSYYEFNGLQEGWFDHGYCLQKKGQRLIWVAEPYHLDSDGLQNLALLASEGWLIQIEPLLGLHFPGWTIPLWLKRQTSQKRTDAGLDRALEG